MTAELWMIIGAVLVAGLALVGLSVWAGRQIDHCFDLEDYHP